MGGRSQLEMGEIMTTIGTSSLDVYPLCLGTNSFGWTADLAAARGVLDEYVGNGGNFIDTADVYGRHKEGNVGGESETMIGAWMAGRNREELVVATKVGFMNPTNIGAIFRSAAAEVEHLPRQGVQPDLHRRRGAVVDVRVAADVQPVAGQGEGRAGLHVLHLTGRGHGIPVKQQYPTPQINKMLFYITK